VVISVLDIHQEIPMKVSKWGNSLAVRLPKKLVEEIGLNSGDELDIVAASKDRIAVEKVDRRSEFLVQMKQFRWSAPEGYKFDRDEANRHLSAVGVEEIIDEPRRRRIDAGHFLKIR
jgi:antitoxin MazE